MMPPSTSTPSPKATGGNAPGTAEVAMRASTVTVALSKSRGVRWARSAVTISSRVDETRTRPRSIEVVISSRSGAGSSSEPAPFSASSVSQPGNSPAKKPPGRSA